jgi:hypothetical protein
LLLENCIFLNCKTFGAERKGGSYIYYTALSLKSCSFNNCSSSYEGGIFLICINFIVKFVGALYFNGSGSASLENSQFVDCKCSHYGGTLEIEVNTAITSCLFDRCKAIGSFLF